MEEDSGSGKLSRHQVNGVVKEIMSMFTALLTVIEITGVILLGTTIVKDIIDLNKKRKALVKAPARITRNHR